MLATPQAQPSERRLSEIDVFCLQTRETGKVEAARRVRFIATALGLVCLALLLGLGLAVSRASAAEQQRDALAHELRLERAARIKATLAASDVEMSAANQALDTRVRNDIVSERMVEQQRRSVELEQLAEKIAQQKMIEADCVTPRSIRTAGL
jgi:uncharacterized protein HemX